MKKYKYQFFIIAIIVLGYMFVGSLDAGNSGDEHYNHDHASYVYKYLQTQGQDSSYLNPAVPLQKYYGQAFDNIVYIINETFNIDDYYTSRHILNAFTGWLLILFTGLTAALLFGWEAGIIALLFMFLSPKILGHSWNNPKDIPFAATYTFALYFILRFIKDLPKRTIWNLIFVAIGLAASISIRIGGLIIIPYLFLFTGIFYLTKKDFYKKQGFLNALVTVAILLGVSIIGYLMGLLLWPYGLKDPIHNPIAALKEMTNFSVGLNQLFNGEITMSKELPWWYGLKYILITSPIVVFIGFIATIVTMFFRKNKRIDYLLHSFLFFAFIFPIAYTIYKHSNLYGGWRHLIWVYSPFVALASGGFAFFICKKTKYIKYGTIAIIALLLIHPAKHIIKNHPYEYVYYNQFVGGVKGAFGNYEMDYYYHSIREGAEWLIENKVNEKDTITVVTNHGRIAQYYFRKYPQVKVRYCRYYEKSKTDWDYAIWANEHITPLQLKKGYWPPKEAIHTMDVDGKPIGAVVKRISHEDYKGFNALKRRKTKEARKHFDSFLKLYPESEEVLAGYARSYIMERQYDSTIVYADKSLKYNPRGIGAYLYKASALNNKKQYAEALKTANEILEIKKDFAEAYFQKGFALKYLNKPNDALKEFQKAVGYKKDHFHQAALYQMGVILCNYKKYKKAIEIYSKILKKRKNDLAATIQTARCYYLMGDKKKAQELLNKIPKNRQKTIEIISLRCRMAIDIKDMETASKYLSMTRNINNNSNLFVLRARFVLLQKNKNMAKKLLDKALVFDSTNNEAKGMLKALQQQGKATSQNNQQGQKTNQQKPKTQQSIMYQKEKKKKTNAVINPFK